MALRAQTYSDLTFRRARQHSADGTKHLHPSGSKTRMAGAAKTSDAPSAASVGCKFDLTQPDQRVCAIDFGAEKLRVPYVGQVAVEVKLHPPMRAE